MPTPLPDPELARIIGKVRTLSERCQEREAACARAKQVALRPSSARRDPFEFAGFAMHGRRCVAIRVGKRAASSCAVWKASVSHFRPSSARFKAPIVA